MRNKDNQPVTKKDLTEILGNVIEQNVLPGVQIIINKSHSKLHTEIYESHNKLRTEIYDLKQDLKKEFIETGAKNKNEILR